MGNCFLFAGPSLSPAGRLVARTRGVTILPPVVRGDIEHLTAKSVPATIVIADGRFGNVRSVGHAELRQALARDWNVWGLSSMGAIRAFELREFGMRGYGRVFSLFCRFRDFQDDEVALLHSTEPPYRAGSEPLLHLRVALRDMLRSQAINWRTKHRIIKQLKTLWFGHRTLTLFKALLRDETFGDRWLTVSKSIKNFERYRIKEHDLTKFLLRSVWLSNGGRERPR